MILNNKQKNQKAYQELEKKKRELNTSYLS